VRVVRFPENPIIRPNMDGRMGDNVNGPSLIRVPEWVERPLGRYYLYFAHHDGRYIRLAYADDLHGPWQTYEPGVLPLEESHFAGHIASPDVQVDEEGRRIRLYYHGSDAPSQVGGPEQFTRVALSTDGLRFEAQPQKLGKPYFRVFRLGGWWYAIGMPGILYRSRDGLTDFEQGPTLFGPNQRHVAVRVADGRLEVFSTNSGDCPESILVSTIDVSTDWRTWRPSEPKLMLAPELDYEGADQPLEPSRRGLIMGPVRQLRDPAYFEQGGRRYLLYAVAGEHGIAAAELVEE
jgi:hypothetical protein